LNYKLADIALTQIGTQEQGGNNRGTEIRAYQAATELSPSAWPWCAAFVDWCVKTWLKDPKAVSWLNLKSMTPEEWRPKTAQAFGLIKWSKDRIHTTKRLSDRSTAQKGDIVVFDFSHTGIVVQDLGNRIVTVEGNTNSSGSREGDGVYRKIRAKSLAQCFIRLTPSTLS